MSKGGIKVRMEGLPKIRIKTPILRQKGVEGTILKTMYNVPKACFSTNAWNTLIEKNCLMLKPIINNPYRNKHAPPIQYPSFVITQNYVILPREFGLKMFGEPEQTLTDFCQNKNSNADWTFRGELRPYQETVCSKAVSVGKGVICASCGTGKTVMAINIICRIKKKTIILLHKQFLLTQWEERIREYAPFLRVGILQQTKEETRDVDVVLAMIQTVISPSKKHIMYDFGLCIIDECHHICCRTFLETMKKVSCPRIGLTATLERPDGLSYSILHSVGDVICDITRNVYCEVDIFEYYGTSLHVDMPYATMVTKLSGDEARNKLISEIVSNIIEDEQRIVLIISSRKSLLRNVHALLLELGVPDKEIGYYIGCTTKKSKQKREQSQYCRIILGTTGVCSEGLDIKALNTVLLATPCKRITQITGRIMRGGATVVPKIVDIRDSHNYIFKNMYNERFRQYQRQKFGITIHT